MASKNKKIDGGHKFHWFMAMMCGLTLSIGKEVFCPCVGCPASGGCAAYKRQSDGAIGVLVGKWYTADCRFEVIPRSTCPAKIPDHELKRIEKEGKNVKRVTVQSTAD